MLRVMASLYRFVRRELLEPPKNLLERYSGGNPAWAVVTGGSSGCGLGLAKALARRGFNLVLIARSSGPLATARAEVLQQSPGVQVEILARDVAALAQDNALCQALLDDVDHATGGGDICLLANVAGDSDLARHLTDKPLARNRYTLVLNAMATLALTHTFLPRLVQRPCRSAVINVGALTALRYAPGFAASSANKSYVRALTMAMSKEYEGVVDLMTAHPGAVMSNILKADKSKGASGLITADAWGEGVLCRLGRDPQVRETFGNAKQEALFRLWIMLDSGEGFLVRSLASIPRYSGYLDREVDLRPIHDKLPSSR